MQMRDKKVIGKKSFSITLSIQFNFKETSYCYFSDIWQMIPGLPWQKISQQLWEIVFQQRTISQVKHWTLFLLGFYYSFSNSSSIIHNSSAWLNFVLSSESCFNVWVLPGPWPGRMTWKNPQWWSQSCFTFISKFKFQGKTTKSTWGLFFFF